jgi:RNA polymerase sigma-70 factor (ECF subfamily)
VQRTLLERIAAGEAAAIDECIDRYRGLIWSLVRRHLRQPADAEDVVQEVFIAIWRNAARFDSRIASESTFITMIARRRLIDRQRKQSRRIEASALVDEPVGRSAAHESLLESSEYANRAREMMGRLREEEQKVLQMAYLDGFSQSQIAEATELPLGTVKTHTRRGLDRLRKLLETAAPAEES